MFTSGYHKVNENIVGHHSRESTGQNRQSSRPGEINGLAYPDYAVGVTELERGCPGCHLGSTEQRHKTFRFGSSDARAGSYPNEGPEAFLRAIFSQREGGKSGVNFARGQISLQGGGRFNQ